ncbi:hypothetical protein BCR35DRAFT_95500 [Leucosporidium creatinivorum]|uniref:Uncharacterized protein n=1 Tax=Leucosporidium creatinivorum TaxID=106004 RepID=A0A1Y2F7B8_9BASI|nr:hypothetical protein BCR35DRAFT_95500 [Leucosporidium creatinivorum]
MSSHEEDPLVKERRKMEQIQLERDQQAFPGEIPAIPELPKFGDRFASFEVALLTLRALVIPITGVGFSPTPESKVSRSAFCNRGGSTYMEARRCGFKIVFRLDSTDDMWVVSKDSFFSHNHGRDRRIIEDPKWRPRSKGGGPYDEAEDLEKVSKSRSTFGIGAKTALALADSPSATASEAF